MWACPPENGERLSYGFILIITTFIDIGFLSLFKFKSFFFKELKTSIYYFRVIKDTFILRDFF